jgi:hypothetical protein
VNLNATGLRPGERLSDYRMVVVRLPRETVTQLQELANTLQMPQ